MHGHIYDAGSNDQANLFTETTKKLTSYTRCTYKEPQDIWRAIEDVKEIDIPMPTRRKTIKDSTLQDKLYKKDIEVWEKRQTLYQQN